MPCVILNHHVVTPPASKSMIVL